MARLDRIHSAALVHDLAHQLGNSLLRETAEGQPLTLVLEIAVGAQGGAPRRWQSGHSHPNRSILSEDLRHRPGSDHAATVDDRQPIADLFHLTQQVGVEEHRGAPILPLPNYLMN